MKSKEKVQPLHICMIQVSGKYTICTAFCNVQVLSSVKLRFFLNSYHGHCIETEVSGWTSQETLIEIAPIAHPRPGNDLIISELPCGESRGQRSTSDLNC